MDINNMYMVFFVGTAFFFTVLVVSVTMILRYQRKRAKKPYEVPARVEKKYQTTAEYTSSPHRTTSSGKVESFSVTVNERSDRTTIERPAQNYIKPKPQIKQTMERPRYVVYNSRAI